MEEKVAALPRKKLEALSLSAVERTKKDTASVEQLAEQIEELRSKDAQITAQLKSIEQEEVNLNSRKVNGEEELQNIKVLLSEYIAKVEKKTAEVDTPDDTPISEETAVDADDPVTVVTKLQALESQLATEVESAKQRLQVFKSGQDAKIDEANAKIDVLKQEVIGGQTLVELKEEKGLLQAELDTLVVDVPGSPGKDDLDAVNAELTRLVEHIQLLQTDMFDAVDAHQRVLHARNAEASLLANDRTEAEAQLDKGRESLEAIERQKEEVVRLQEQLEEEKSREGGLREDIDPLQSECDQLASELARVREENAARIKEVEEAQARFKEKKQENDALLQEQEEKRLAAVQRMEKCKADSQQKLDDVKGKADDRLSGLQQKIENLRAEVEAETNKVADKDILQENLEETRNRYQQVLQQAASKIQTFEETAKTLMETLKDKQEELVVLQGMFKNTSGKEAVISVEEDEEKTWMFNGDNWYETTNRSGTLQQKSGATRKRLEVDVETLCHKVDNTRRARELLDTEFDSYKQRAQLAEESHQKQHSDLRQAEFSVADMESRLNGLLVRVKEEQEKSNTLNQRLRDRRQEYGHLCEYAMDIDVEVRSLDAKRKMLQDQLSVVNLSVQSVVRENEERREKEFQSRLRALELDLSLQTELLPKLRVALEELEAIRDPADNSDCGTPMTPRDERTPSLSSHGSVNDDVPPTFPSYEEPVPATSAGWNELIKHREILRQVESELLDERLRLKGMQEDIRETLDGIRAIKEKNTLEENLHEPMQLEYIRNIFTRYLDVSPIGTSEHEQLIRVVMTFFQFSPVELAAMEEKRKNQGQGSSWSFFSSGAK